MVFLFSTVGRWVRWPFARFARSDFFFFASLKYINSRAKPGTNKKKKANKHLTFTTAKKYFGTQKYKSMSERIKNQHHIMHNKTKNWLLLVPLLLLLSCYFHYFVRSYSFCPMFNSFLHTDFLEIAMYIICTMYIAYTQSNRLYLHWV